MATEENKVEETGKKKKSKAIPIILGVLILGGLIFGIKEYLFYKNFTTTDDAQIDGDINPVIARVSGYVEKINFKDNQFVHAGDTLVILDDRDYQVQLEEANAGLNTTNAQVDVSLSNVATTGANLGPATADVKAAQAQLWKINQDYARYKNLIEAHAITQSQFDAIAAQKQTAEAQLAAAQKRVAALSEQVSTTKQQVGATKSNVAARQANIDLAKLHLSYTVITAPVSGVVSKRNIQIGQLVQAGQVMFAIVNTNHIYVTANMKETQLDGIKVGQPVNIQVDAYPDKKVRGIVQSFAGATGAKFSLLPPDNATGNFVKVVQRIPIRIDFDSLSSEDRLMMRPGMSVFVTVDVRKK